MARYYNRRRFARRVRRMRRSKRSSLSRVKRDILKCNFPTKVKFMGLTEKKVMFLTKNFQISMTGNTTANPPVPGTQQIILDPMSADNIASLYSLQTRNIPNWDKMCILGIYIKFQPLKNMWAAVAPNAAVDNINIEQVKCTYNMNIVNINRPQNGAAGTAPAIAYDRTGVNYKQVFTFNSNEAFTMYLPAPTTMSSEDPCVHRSKTWWSIANIQAHSSDDDGFIKGTKEYCEEDDNGMIGDDDDDVPEYSAIFPESTDRPYICAGRLFFSSMAAKYNVTINYKVALKG